MLEVRRRAAWLLFVALFPASVLAGNPGDGRATSSRALGFGDGGSPAEPLHAFDDVILDPARTSAGLVAELKRLGTAAIAALGSDCDEARLAQRLSGLLHGGYAGFLLDGRGGADAPTCLRRAHRLAPGARLFWRGSLAGLSSLPRPLAGVLLDNQLTRPDGRRSSISETEIARRIATLATEARRAGVTLVLVENVAAGARPEARSLARQIAAAGLVPWVQVGASAIGVGLTEIVPRRILGLYDGLEVGSFLPETELHRRLALPLEYLGYVLDYCDVRKGLPPGDLSARYAGIVTWFSDGRSPLPSDYADWLVRQIDRGVRLAIFGQLKTRATPALVERMQIEVRAADIVAPVTIVGQDNLMGFEAPVSPLTRGLSNWSSRTGSRHLERRDATGQIVTPVVTDRWGGFAFEPYILEAGFNAGYRWCLDPFAFLAQALDLQALPVPDPTTESGKRLLLVHVDGDGFVSRAALPDAPFAGQVVLDRFLRKHRVPTTVSFIEGEIAPTGLYPGLSPALEAVAREIAALPHVELASHTYSHPFDWPLPPGQGLPVPPDAKRAPHLPIPGYRYQARREVVGSVDYVKRRIAPPDKPVRGLLWSGNALPAEDVLREAAAIGVFNMNGGNCGEPIDQPVLTQVPSLCRPEGAFMQVYAPAQNDNVYNDNAADPTKRFFGFRNVIKMFEFTETPRRLKPIDIYYHFYAGISPTTIDIVDDIYDWAQKQEPLPLFASEYVQLVEDFQRVTLARHLDGSWQIDGLGHLRTLRIDDRLGWPDLDRCRAVAGVSAGPGGRWVAVAPNQKVVLAFRKEPPTLPHLRWAKGRVVSWQRADKSLTFELRGHQPVELEIDNCPGLVPGVGKPIWQRATRKGAGVVLAFASSAPGSVEITCR